MYHLHLDLVSDVFVKCRPTSSMSFDNHDRPISLHKEIHVEEEIELPALIDEGISNNIM